MPIYDFSCPAHGTMFDIYAEINEREKQCPLCDSVMTRLFPLSVNISPDIQPYIDEHMGKDPVYVKSRKHKKQLLKERGLVQIG